MKQTPAMFNDTGNFEDALSLFLAAVAVAKYNTANLRANSQPFVAIEPIHSCFRASKTLHMMPVDWSTQCT